MSEVRFGSWLDSEHGWSADQLLDLRPDLDVFRRQFERQIWREGDLDPILIEVCRLRMAQLLGDHVELERRSEPAMKAGLTESKVAALPHWSTDKQFSRVERAALAVAELFVIDVHAVTDEQMHALCAHLDPPQVVALTTAFALFDGFGRFRGAMTIPVKATVSTEIGA